MTEPANPDEVVEDAGAVEVPAAVEPGDAPPLSTKDRISAARLPERTVDLCLRGDLQAEWEDLHRQLREADARHQGDKRLNSGGESKRLAQQIESLQEQMRADTIVFRMRALSRRAWSDLLKDHPPRKGDADDEAAGFNLETFPIAAIRACTYEPNDLDDADWAHLLDDAVTEWQFVQLQNTAFALNSRKVDVPNSFAASRILRPSEPE